VMHGRTRMDGKTVPSCLRSQALEVWAEFNFGDRKVSPRPWWDTTPLDDLSAKAGVDQMTAQAAGTRINAGITTPNEERARIGLPKIEGGDVLRGGTPLADAAPASPANAESVEAEPNPAATAADDDPEQVN